MTLCPNCQQELHPSDAVRHGYAGPAHDPSRCIELLRMRIAALEAENAALKAGVDDAHAELDWLDAEFIGFANGSHGHLRVKRALATLDALRKEGK